MKSLLLSSVCTTLVQQHKYLKRALTLDLCTISKIAIRNGLELIHNVVTTVSYGNGSDHISTTVGKSGVTSPDLNLLARHRQRLALQVQPVRGSCAAAASLETVSWSVKGTLQTVTDRRQCAGSTVWLLW